MNRAYRIVWSAARQAWIVASEKAGCGGRPPAGSQKSGDAPAVNGRNSGPAGGDGRKPK